MTKFPDGASQVTDLKLHDPDWNTYAAGDKHGYILFDHDVTADGAQTGLVRYVSVKTTANWYTVEVNGTLTQYDTEGTQTNP